MQALHYPARGQLAAKDDAGTKASAAPSLSAFLLGLQRLRWIAVAGQALTIVVVTGWLALPLPFGPLSVGLAVLAGFNLWLLARPARPLEHIALLHLAIDFAVLSWQLYWTGGPANPFVSLFIVPITLAAVALPVRAVGWAAAMAAIAYAGLWLDHVPLPHVHGEFDLHLFGMWVNFMITVGVVVLFGARSAGALAAQRAELARIRERSLADEGLMALASLGAGAAHALNTPLSTMTVLLADVRRDPTATVADIGADLELLGRQVDACRDAVRSLVSEAQPDAGPVEPAPLRSRVDAALARWRLLRPAFELRLTLPDVLGALPVCVDRGFDHLLWNLLDNAADASQAQAMRTIGIELERRGDALVVCVVDRGRGLAAMPTPFRSRKPGGMGLGLALAQRICERYDGALSLTGDDTGTRVCAHLSLAALGVRQ